MDKDEKIEELEDKVVDLSRLLVNTFNYASNDPNSFLQRARVTAEAICKFIYIKEIGEFKKANMMLDALNKELTHKKIIPKRIGILIGTIQTFGNYVSHAQDDLSDASKEWSSTSQIALANLTNWFFVDYLNGDVPVELKNNTEGVLGSDKGNAFNKDSGDVQRTGKSNKKMILLSISFIIITMFIVLYFIMNNKKTEDLSKNNKIVIKEPDNSKSEKIEKNKGKTISEFNNKNTNIKRKRIAVLYFDNTSDEKKLDKLKKGFASMMISDLSKIKMLNIVERDRLEEIIKEQELSNTRKFDKNTAVKIGKLLGAEYILTGSYFELMGKLRIDTKIIKVETSEIVKAEGIDGKADLIFDLEKKLVIEIIKGLELKLDPEISKKFLKENQKSSLNKLILYSEALEFYDLKEYDNALVKLEEIKKKNPEFLLAKKLLIKIKEKIK